MFNLTSFLSSSIPIDGETRTRRALLTGGVAVIARLVQMTTLLVSVPITLHYLGVERFGLWMAMSSMLAMAGFADFGVGNGVLTTVARAFGEGNTEEIKVAVSSGFYLLSAVACFLLIAFCSIYRLIDWSHFFKVSSPLARHEAGPALTVFVACFALNLPFDVVQRLQLGLQQGYRYGQWQLMGSVLALCGIVCGVLLHVSLPVLMVALAGAPLLSAVMNSAYYWCVLRPDLRPQLRFVTGKMMLQIIRLGSMFFILQMMVVVALSGDNFLIARTLGAASVAAFSVSQRIFMFVSLLTSILLTGLWPAYGEALSRGHIEWVRTMLRRSLYLTFVGATVATACLLVSARVLIRIWVGPQIEPHWSLLVGLALWTVCDCMRYGYSMFLNASAMKFQLIVATVFGVCCLTAKVFLMKRFGVAAVPWSAVVTFIIFSAIPCALYDSRLWSRVEKQQASASV